MATVILLAMAGCHLSESGEEEGAGERKRLAAETVMITKPARADGGLCPTLVVAGGQALVASSVATQHPYHADNPGVAEAAADSASATWLLAYAGRGDEAAPALIALPAGQETGLLNLTIAYPEQRAGKIVTYPFTIAGGATTISGITLGNSYNGMLIEVANGCMLAGIQGTGLKRGMVAPHSSEFSWMHDVQFANTYWGAHAAEFAGAPLSPAEIAALDPFTRANLTGLELGRLDALAIPRFTAVDAALPVLIRKNEKQEKHRVLGFGGVVAEFPDRREEVDPWYYGMHYANLDNVPEAQGKTYRFARTPAAARLGADDFMVVTAPPFTAAGDGQADDTRAIQDALDHAGAAGGGLVYLPQGVYRVSALLTVPAGVELRGAVGRGFIRQYRETCTLAVDGGSVGSDLETAPAAITLGARSGIRGLSIVYPDQGRSAARLKPYPWTIRGNGPRVWAVDLTFMRHQLGDRRDQVQVFGEVSLATGKPATPGPDPTTCRNPESAVDRDPDTFWQGPAGSWLQVDLGGVRTLGRFGVASAWASFGKDSYVRRCELQVSEDGASFTTADTLDT